MNFPPINAVDDGVFVYVGVSILTGICGSVNLWAKHYEIGSEKYKLVDLVRISMNCLMPIFVIVAFKNIYKKRETEHMHKIFSWKYFIA